jgi:multimeric flavodoxin WrbA
MRVLLLNGATGPDPLLDALGARLRDTLELRGATVETVLLRIESIAWCQGCFECWTRTPGVCKIDDDGRDLAREFVQSDLVILLTPSRFGGYSSESKKLLDRTLGMLLPFFRRVDGEVHHAPRYAQRPGFGVLAVLRTADFDAELTVRTLAQRNAVNFASPVDAVQVVTRDSTIGVQLAACDTLVDTLVATPGAPRREARSTIRHPDELLPAMARYASGIRPRRALGVVGSAKPRGASTSESLAIDLLERLAMHGVEGDIRHVHREAHDLRTLATLVAAVRDVDLLVIAAPVYIDSLPWLVTRLLEAIADDRASLPAARPLAVTMLLNCGFPEARHAAVARTIGALFARDAKAHWAGALQLGAGEAIHGRPLVDAGVLGRRLMPALDAAAAALAAGERLSDEAVMAFQVPQMPIPLYMMAGDAQWLWSATHEGTVKDLWARPLVTTDN